jgi:3-oxoacyl-[acyl-carrier-protein] synthase-3
MRYTRVHIESFGYELPPVVVSTRELEERLAPLYRKLHIPVGQVEHKIGRAHV